MRPSAQSGINNRDKRPLVTVESVTAQFNLSKVLETQQERMQRDESVPFFLFCFIKFFLYFQSLALRNCSIYNFDEIEVSRIFIRNNAENI